ncbi:MAG: alpha/beta hydrolase [Agathobacter sp.]|nr:alpha/beta hydrolase [Agathobacter sp.]
MSIMSFMMRRGCKKSDAKRDEGLVYPDNVIRIEDISYGPHKMNVLDVYRPQNGETKLPVIVSVHGGGWVYGDKKLYSHYCVSLAQRGFVVVNFTYRLSPESKFPCHLEDTAKVFDWVLKNGAQFGMDRDNIFAVGDSAGGHILALFSAMCTNPEFAAKFDFKAPENFVPRAIALNCAVLDMDVIKNSSGSNTMTLMKDVLPKGKMEEYLQLANPIAYVNEKFPPCFIMTCNEDFLKDQPETFKKKLDDCKVPYVYKFYGDEANKLGHVFHLDMRNQTGVLCNDEECEYFKTRIK